MRSTRPCSALPFLLLVLAACGGGGSSGGLGDALSPAPGGGGGGSTPAPGGGGGTSPLPGGAVARWSDPATWPGGRVPRAGDSVTITAGMRVLLDTATAPLRALSVFGTLEADPTRDVAITSKWIMVHGQGSALQIGTEAAPYPRRAVITLTGTPSDPEVMQMGRSVLGVMEGGRLDLHGLSATKTSWTRLAADAPAGSTSLTLADAVTWEPGDTLVIAPSGSEPEEADVVVVTGASGTSVSVSPALRFTHLGRRETIEGRTVDMRAEVGLLTRNVVVRSDPAARATRQGGHVMVMGAGALARVSGTTFRELGQETRIGRYAFHWHLVGAANGGYVRRSAVFGSFTRGVVVHGTSAARVEDVVTYETHSHAFVPSEDGTESDNVIRRNLSVLVRRLPDARRLQFQDDGIPDPSIQDEHRPSGFWLARGNQIVEGNVAAGATAGNGFHVENDNVTMPRLAMVFRDNVAHSNASLFHGGNDRYPPLTSGHGFFFTEFGTGTNLADATPLRFERLTAYKNGMSGVWLEDAKHVVDGAVLSDNGTGTIVFGGTVERSLVIGRSFNTLGQLKEVGDANLAGAVHVMGGQGPDKRPVIRDVTVVDGRDASLVVLESHVLSAASVRGLRSVRTRTVAGGNDFVGVVTDLDGSLTPSGAGLIVPERSLFGFTAGCTAHAALGVRHCPSGTPIMLFRLQAMGSGTSLGRFTLRRDDGVTRSYPPGDEAPERFHIEPLAAGRTYAMLNGVGLPAGIEVAADDWYGAATGRTLDLVLPASHAQLFGFRGTGDDRELDLTRPLTRAASLAEAQARPGLAYWVEPGSGAVHVRLSTASLLYACATANCR